MKSKNKKALSIVLSLFILLGLMTAPAQVMAATHLTTLYFESEAERTFALGSTKTVNFRLYDSTSSPYTGSVTAYFIKPDQERSYVSVSGAQGFYSIKEYTFDQVGSYTIVVLDADNFTAQNSVNVLEPKIVTDGTLELNYTSTITVKLLDFNDKPLARQSITVDGTEVGVNSVAYSTLFDGTFKFTMTPIKVGIVKLMLGGHTFGTLEVKAAYTTGERIGGMTTDNSALSVAVAQKGWTSAESVILTRDDVVADAMVSVPLSKKFDAPILMCSPDIFGANVLTEIRRLGTKNVYIIGGTGAVSEATEQLLKAEGLKVVRYAGQDRYETAALIANALGASDTVYLAYGYGEPDALAASAFAADKRIPILLTETSELPAATQSTLVRIAPTRVSILGGSGIIDNQLEDKLRTQYAVTRWGGVDRYGTQQIILQNLVRTKTTVLITSSLVSPQDVADGKPFGNALLAAALAAKNGGFVITVPQLELPNALAYSLLYNKGYISSSAVVGDVRAVSLGLEQQISEILKH